MSHTYLTFEFFDGTCLSFSFETRRERGKKYHPWTGLWRSYELYLLVGFERDVTQLRTHGRNNIVSMYRVITPPDKERQMIVQMTHRLNQLASRPEFYHTLFKTCNTSIVNAVNAVTPGRIPFGDVVGATIKGCQFPLDNESLTTGTRGISNIATGPSITVSVESGDLLLLIMR